MIHGEPLPYQGTLLTETQAMYVLYYFLFYTIHIRSTSKASSLIVHISRPETKLLSMLTLLGGARKRHVRNAFDKASAA